MPFSLMEIGERIRGGYASSPADGQATWMSFAGESLQVFHVPGLPSDGAPITAEQMRQAGVAENALFSSLAIRIAVNQVRPAGEDMLILETAFSGVAPQTGPFSFPLTLILKFKGGRIERLIQVAPPEMMATLGDAAARLRPDAAGAAAH